MNYISVIKIKLNELVFGKSRTKKDVTPYDCAELVGKSYNYLWKISAINEDHPFPLEFIVPIMKAKNNFDVLQEMAHECGFALVKLPRTKMSKGDEADMASAMQLAAGKVVAAFIDYGKSGKKDHYLQLIDAIWQDIQTKLAVKGYVDRKQTKQEELF